MKLNNSNLNKAKSEKDDEFYTQLSDIEKELKYYASHLKEKIVYCNCDNSEQSAFWKYFHLHFKELGLKKLISTYYSKDKVSYKMIYEGKEDIKTPLLGDGDFRSSECISLLKEADVIITNPPYSLFREYIAQLMEYNKKFLVIGNQNAVTYKDIFPLIKNNQIWWGINCVRWFVVNNLEIKHKENSEGQIIAEGARSRWYTNLDHKKRHESLLNKIKGNYYLPEKYPKYENYNAINIDKVSELPIDYDGVMGVPITFLDKYNSEEFRIVGMAEDNGKGQSGKEAQWDGKNARCIINGKKKYKRIFVKRKQKDVTY